MYMYETVESVTQKIRAAFENAVRPGFNEIIFGNGEGRTDDFKAVQFLSGFRWQDLDLESLTEVPDVLPILTEKAFKYYLPAFLLAALDFVEADSISHSVVFILSPPQEKKTGDYRVSLFKKRTSGLTAEQVDAIRAFASYICREYSYEFDDPEDDMSRNFKEYWTATTSGG